MPDTPGTTRSTQQADGTTDHATDDTDGAFEPAPPPSRVATGLTSHPTDRLALGVGLLLAMEAVIVIAQQAGWIHPSPATLVALAVFALAAVGLAAAAAILREDRTRHTP